MNLKNRTKKPLPHTAASGAQNYTPLTARDLPRPVLRPGAADHEKHGSRQADGSVKPYIKPTHACVGKLLDNAARLTPEVIAKHKKQHHAHRN